MNRLMEILKTIKPEVDFENSKALLETGALDSLEIVEIIAEIEKQYEIEITPDQIEPDNFQSVDTMWKMIQNLKEM